MSELWIDRVVGVALLGIAMVLFAFGRAKLRDIFPDNCVRMTDERLTMFIEAERNQEDR